jgi:hypothetical protein
LRAKPRRLGGRLGDRLVGRVGEPVRAEHIGRPIRQGQADPAKIAAEMRFEVIVSGPRLGLKPPRKQPHVERRPIRRPMPHRAEDPVPGSHLASIQRRGTTDEHRWTRIIPGEQIHILRLL